VNEDMLSEGGQEVLILKKRYVCLYRSNPNYVVTYFCRDLIMSFVIFCHKLDYLGLRHN